MPEAPPEAPAAAPEAAPAEPAAPAGPADSFAAQAPGGQRDQGDTFQAAPATTDGVTAPAGGRTWDPTKDKEIPAGLPGDNYSPDKPGWHQYEVTNTIATADQQVSPEQMRDYMTRHAFPGQDPSKPISQQGEENTVRDPRGLGRDLQNGRWLTTGESDKIKTYTSNDGLSISNFTQPGHALHDGRITRTATQQPDGSWTMTTRGYGNNDGKFLGNNWLGGATANPYMAARLNEWQGQRIFNDVDRAMTANIRAHNPPR
jgi:hypothetical protein